MAKKMSRKRVHTAGKRYKSNLIDMKVDVNKKKRHKQNNLKNKK